MPPADLIEHKQVEAALREGEERVRWLASIVESSDDAIISKTLDSIITSWNEGAERMFGYTAKEAVGKPVTILIPPDRQDEERTILERIGRGERIEHYETVRQCKDGSLIAISLTISPIRDVEGRIVGAAKIARDITERKQAEARENMLLAQLAHLNRVATAGELSTSIAHELGQPLTSISLNAETAQHSLASERPDIDAVREALGDIVNDCLRAKTIITNLKSMFRKEAGVKSEADINELIGIVMGLVSAELQKHQVELKMELNDQLPSVLASHVQIQQVLLNLVVNAIDAMRSVHPRVLSVKSKLTGLDSCMSRSRIPGLELAAPTSTKSSSHYLRLKNMAWGWVFPSVVRSSSITAVAFGHHRVSLEVQSFNLNYRMGIESAGPPMFAAMSASVTSRHAARVSGCPLYARKRTSEARAAMSAMGHNRTFRTCSYARPLPISISTVMCSLPFDSNRNRRERTSSRTARRSVAASRK